MSFSGKLEFRLGRGVASRFLGGVIDRALRLLLPLATALACVWAAAWPGPADQKVSSARWFIPGAIGYEPARVEGRNRRSGDAPQPRPFLTRVFSGFETEAAQVWAVRNGATAGLEFSHALNRIFPPALHATRPEFFPLVGGRRHRPEPGLANWNPDIAREDVAAFAAEAARKHFRDRPQATSFSVGTNDGLLWGESEELRREARPGNWFRGRPDYSNVVFRFTNRVAELVSRSHPDKYIGALAYFWSERPPDFPLHPQVVPFYTADRAQDYDPVFRAEETALLRRWAGHARTEAAAAAAPRLGLYDYSYGYGFLILRIYSDAMARYMGLARGAGFTDYYAEIYPNWSIDPLTPWLSAQLALDPERPVNELRDEFFTRYFGPAAAAAARYFSRAEAIWQRQPPPAYWLKHFRNESQAELYKPEDLAALKAALADADSATVGRSARYRARVARLREGFSVMERFVEFHWARVGLTQAALAADPDLPAVQGLLDRYRRSRREFVSAVVGLQQRDPDALARTPWRRFLSNDPAFLAESRLGLARPSGPVELLADAAWAGPLAAARIIADLPYGIPQPDPWHSRVEPRETHRAEWVDFPDGRLIRLTGTVDTQLGQWTSTGGSSVHVASIKVRGRLSPGASAQLTVAWLGANNRHLAFRSVRLPVGEWPEWVTLRQSGPAPAGAVSVGMSLRVENQVAGDWIEARGASLRAQD